MENRTFAEPNYRTQPEQWVGFAIYLGLSFSFQWISGFPGSLYFVCLAAGMWVLWRKRSLNLLKMELSVFLSQYLFQMMWSLSFFAKDPCLLSLVALLLLWSNTLLAALLFWKKDRYSGFCFLFPLIWVFYLAGLNMVSCVCR